MCRHVGRWSGRLRLVAWYWLQALTLAWHYSMRVSPHGIPLNDKGLEPMTSLLSDLRYGVRMLLKTPLVSVIATLTIAMGITLTVHTFSIVYGTVMRGLPLPNDDRLMQILQNNTEAGFQGMSLGIHDYLDSRDQSDTFEELGTYYRGTVNLDGDDQPPERYEGAFVSANALSLLGVPPLLGRTFVAGEDSSDAEASIVIGYAVWRNRFGGDPNIVGRTLRINGETGAVLGVMPEGFRFPFNQEVWIPHRAEVDEEVNRGGGRFETFGRLRTDVSVEAAAAEISAITERIKTVFPEEMAGIESYISPFEHRYMPPQITAAMWVQLAAVFGVLLIACANVANLLLARASVRGRCPANRVTSLSGRGGSGGLRSETFLGLCHEPVDHGHEIVRFAIGHQLTIGARPTREDGLRVEHLLANIELVDDVLDKVEHLANEKARRHRLAFAEVNQLAVEAPAYGPPFVLLDEVVPVATP